jgi:hypothetical protein
MAWIERHKRLDVEWVIIRRWEIDKYGYYVQRAKFIRRADWHLLELAIDELERRYFGYVGSA